MLGTSNSTSLSPQFAQKEKLPSMKKAVAKPDLTKISSPRFDAINHPGDEVPTSTTSTQTPNRPWLILVGKPQSVSKNSLPIWNTPSPFPSHPKTTLSFSGASPAISIAIF